jgi:steroid 5-alpha reductase family enzyme
MVTAWLVASAASLVAVSVAMVVTAAVARRLGRVSVVDVTWGLGFVAVALVSAGVGMALGRGDRWHDALVVVVVAAWGGRLAWHILRRSRGHGEDPRYEKIMGVAPTDPGWMSRAVRKVFVPQALAIWVVSLPLQVAGVAEASLGFAVWAGLVVWASGLMFEVVGDAQLSAYKEQPRESRPQILDTGLWAWTRHPNYFGDACVWWGIWLLAGLASGWPPGLLTVVSPVVMTYVLRNVTGAKLLERTMSKRPGWEEYADRVPLFFPRPPRPPSRS